VATSNRAYALSDVGLARSNNQDSGYAGRYLYAVADGMGGHAGGDVASAIVIRGLAELDLRYDSAPAAEAALRAGLVEAQESIADMVAEHAQLAGMGTTVSAIALAGGSIVVAHIGDSRIYRLRDGVLEQMTADHTFVQRLVDTGRITQEEAAHHPRRSVLMRVLGDIDQSPEVDTAILETRPGDRWLLCSDGLSSYVGDADIRRSLTGGSTPAAAATALVRDTMSAGAPDNVTVVILDIGGDDTDDVEPVIVGSASIPLEFSAPRTRSHARLPSILRHPLRSATIEDTHFEPEADEYLAALVVEDRRRLGRRRATAITLIILAALVVAALLWLAYSWTQTRFFVGPYQGTTEAYQGKVAVYQGVQQDLGPISLHHLAYVVDDLALADLPTFRREQVEQTISLGSLQEADATVRELRDAAAG
jgi:protein phosphatase